MWQNRVINTYGLLRAFEPMIKILKVFPSVCIVYQFNTIQVLYKIHLWVNLTTFFVGSIESGSSRGNFFMGQLMGFIQMNFWDLKSFNKMNQKTENGQNAPWCYRKEVLRCRFSSTSLRKTSLSIPYGKIIKLSQVSTFSV